MKILKLLLFLGLMAFTFEISAQTIYVTKTGEKYHKSSCRYLKNSKNEITLEVAKSRGFTACSVCKPNGDSATPSQSVQPVKSEPTTPPPKVTATQCTGKTKAGARCKRMTKDASGRCYQH